ncbi:hypothetical protein [Lysinibacillus xylanilyticus]|uniref:hypothetical protein n=1 Tax=Lysinibacillus xylanilyticus TaxID=582475 RepID=UPI0038212281
MKNVELRLQLFLTEQVNNIRGNYREDGIIGSPTNGNCIPNSSRKGINDEKGKK